MNKWYFASTGRGQEDGFNDPVLEFFQGDYDKYLAREILQNSLDARVNDDIPVTVRFVKYEIDPSELPGVEELSNTIRRAKQYASNQSRPEKFYTSAEYLLSQKIHCLKISDYNTTGLCGSDDEREGSWHKLTKAQGVNNLSSHGGGSFGIGKGAPFVASALRTVFYSTYNKNDEYIFQGVSRLSSFEDANGDIRRGVGAFGHSHRDQIGVESIRQVDNIPIKYRRNPSAGPGSDVHIIGYRTPGDWRSTIISSILGNFWIAIYYNDLNVELIDRSGTVVINRESLALQIEEYSSKGEDDLLGHYLAVTESDYRFDEEIPVLGQCHLYLKKGEGLNNRIQMTRSPKMVVFPKRVNIPEQFAGVFICDDKKGNLILRELEPATHDKWDRARIYEGGGNEKIYGSKALKCMNDWISEKLSLISSIDDKLVEEIPDLGKYLPAEDNSIKPDDSLAERGFDSRTLFNNSDSLSKSRKPAVRKQAPAIPARTGRPSSAIKNGKGSVAKNKTGTTEHPDSSIQRLILRTEDIQSREFKSDDGRRYVIRTKSATTQTGSMKIVIFGEDGAMFEAPVKEACYYKSREPIVVEGNELKKVALEATTDNLVEVNLLSDRRYSLGVENYE